MGRLEHRESDGTSKLHTICLSMSIEFLAFTIEAACFKARRKTHWFSRRVSRFRWRSPWRLLRLLLSTRFCVFAVRVCLARVEPRVSVSSAVTIFAVRRIGVRSVARNAAFGPGDQE
jgi:hypothetical protein